MCEKAWLAAPVLFMYAEVTKTIIFSSMGPTLSYPTVFIVNVDLLQGLTGSSNDATVEFSAKVRLLRVQLDCAVQTHAKLCGRMLAAIALDQG